MSEGGLVTEGVGSVTKSESLVDVGTKVQASLSPRRALVTRSLGNEATHTRPS